MRQEVDIRYVVTSLKGRAEYLYEDVYCGRGQMESLIKLHRAQLASDRMSCHSATANQVRLALHTAAYWLMLAVRDAISHTDPLAKAEFATIRERLIKIGARVVEHLARIRIQLPTSCPGDIGIPLNGNQGQRNITRKSFRRARASSVRAWRQVSAGAS